MVTSILAAIGVLTIAVLLWRAFGPERGGLDTGGLTGFRGGRVGNRNSAGYRATRGPEATRPHPEHPHEQQGPIGPDDDPEFLRRISDELRQSNQRNRQDPDSRPTDSGDDRKDRGPDNPGADGAGG